MGILGWGVFAILESLTAVAKTANLPLPNFGSGAR
jgi:hypothetical protein